MIALEPAALGRRLASLYFTLDGALSSIGLSDGWHSISLPGEIGKFTQTLQADLDAIDAQPAAVTDNHQEGGEIE